MLSLKRHISISARTKKQKLYEFFRFDSKTASFFLSLIYILRYLLVRLCKGDLSALIAVGELFRHTQLRWCREWASRILMRSIKRHGQETVGEFFLSTFKVDEEMLLRLKKSIKEGITPFFRRLIILSPPENQKKGVLLIKFNLYFLYLPHVFDLNRLMKDYVLVLEPSFCGYFNPAILSLLGRSAPIVIQASEEVDYQFIKSLNSNLIPIDIGANYWVDNRKFFPVKDCKKKYDIIMVALWADFKRHFHLFEAISKCKNRNKIKVCLAGMPYPHPVDYIRDLARHYKVDDCIEYFENISQAKMNLLMNESKICLLLSKKEGFNKSIIESLYAGTPIYILNGFNYGEKYLYINEQTGGYIEGKKLHHFIESIDNILQEGNFNPHEWVSKNITAEKTTERLRAILHEAENEKINRDLSVKINNPDCDYLEHSCWERFFVHYKSLKKYLR